MTAAHLPQTVWRYRRVRLIGTILFVALLAALGLGSVFRLFRPVAARAQDSIGSSSKPSNQGQKSDQPGSTDPCLASLPDPTPIPPAVRVIQLVNCSNQTLLGAANASGVAGATPYPVYPREKTWVMQPVGSANNANVLTIDIPPQSANTGPKKSIGPNFWARSGCRYDVASGRAQCETGGCGGQYDCSSADLGISPFTTFTEWNFYQPVSGKTYHLDNYDISVVNGASLNVDIQMVGGDTAILAPRTIPCGNT